MVCIVVVVIVVVTDHIISSPVISLTIRRHTLTTGEPVQFEMRWKKEPKDSDDPDYLWIQSACIPIRSTNGAVTRISGCNITISAHKEATRAALLRAEAEKRLATFLEISPVAFFQLNRNLQVGVLSIVNPTVYANLRE